MCVFPCQGSNSSGGSGVSGGIGRDFGQGWTIVEVERTIATSSFGVNKFGMGVKVLAAGMVHGARSRVRIGAISKTGLESPTGAKGEPTGGTPGPLGRDPKSWSTAERNSLS